MHLPAAARLLLLSAVLATAARAQDVFDLRSAGPGGVSWVPEVQNQSNLGTCWAFATTTALNSNLIKNGLLPTSTEAPPMAVSQWHLIAYNGAAQNTFGDDENYNGFVGGDVWMTTSYYTRGQGAWAIPGATTGTDYISTMGGGPVLVSSSTFNIFPQHAVNNGDNLAPHLPPVSQEPGFTVTGAYYFDQPHSGRNDAEQVSAVKAALQQYGALSTYMYAGGYKENDHDVSVFHYDETLGYEYSYDPGSDSADHVVTIIGWDDNVIIPQGSGSTTGAWIVQNSWGSWGGTLERHDGTFYAAYNDPFIGKQGVTAFTATTSGIYSPTVLQNEVGPTYASGNWGTGNADIPSGMGIIDASRSDTALSILTSDSDGLLLALGLTSLDAQADESKLVSISIYDGVTIVDGDAVFGNLLGSDSFTFLENGYTLFDLDNPISLTLGQQIVIVVDYNGSPVPYVWQAESLNNEAAPIGLTYFLDGTDWSDFGAFTASGDNDDYTGIFTLKGLMAVPEPGTLVLLLAGLGPILLARRRAA